MQVPYTCFPPEGSQTVLQNNLRSYRSIWDGYVFCKHFPADFLDSVTHFRHYWIENIKLELKNLQSGMQQSTIDDQYNIWLMTGLNILM